MRREPEARAGRASNGEGRGALLRRAVLVILVSLALGSLLAGCSSLGASESKQIKLGIRPWDENVAISTLTKVLLEEDLGYDNVELQSLELEPIFEEVADGDLDAFQDIWIPNHQDYLDEVADSVEHLDPWFKGETAFGIAVPTYMEVRSLADLDEAGTDMIIGIEPDAAFMPYIHNKVIPAYDLDVKLVEANTPAMLAELERAYEAREPIVFLGWSPHWMNAEYDFRYLEDPKDAQGDFDESAEISTIVREDLEEDDPMAYELMRSISLTDDQVNALEVEINESGNPVTGVKVWLKDNRKVVQPWIDAAETTEES